LPVEVDVSAALRDLGSNVFILVEGVSLTSYKFNRSHPVVFYQYNGILFRLKRNNIVSE
jgi:hypothetical protein